MSNSYHTPVLLKKAVDYLDVGPGKKYIDATLGGGGHGLEIVKRGGIVLGIDVDQEAIEHVEAEVRKWKVEVGKDLVLVRGNFKDLAEIARSNGFEKADGILFDLGVSSHELEAENRGFSFQKEAPLDMRMDLSTGSGQAVTAADLINGLTKKELYELFSKLGEEQLSWAISNNIIRARKIKPIMTTKQLAGLIIDTYRRCGMKRGKIHPATKVFQALRIAVNDELNNLRAALPQALDLLAPGGRLVVISFHSGEDRIVKQWAHQQQTREKPITPSLSEIENNPRARSAKMRILQKRVLI